MSTKRWERAWCYYCNLVHSVYREARHIGMAGDPKAKFIVSDSYLQAAQKCFKNRCQLKSSVPFRHVAAPGTDSIIQVYQALTDLSPADLVTIFSTPGWVPSYGGQKWARITQVLLRLKQQIDEGALDEADQTCEDIRRLEHNSGPLVPTLEAWRHNPYLREKWPGPWDADG